MQVCAASRPPFPAVSAHGSPMHLLSPLHPAQHNVVFNPHLLLCLKQDSTAPGCTSSPLWPGPLSDHPKSPPSSSQYYQLPSHTPLALPKTHFLYLPHSLAITSILQGPLEQLAKPGPFLEAPGALPIVLPCQVCTSVPHGSHQCPTPSQLRSSPPDMGQQRLLNELHFRHTHRQSCQDLVFKSRVNSWPDFTFI